MKIKICGKCNKRKTIDNFSPSRNQRRKYDVASYCKKCRRKISKIYAKKRYKEAVEWLREYKSKLKCPVCGENHPAAIMFHHKDPKEKKFNISASVIRKSKEEILEEIEKCKVLCKNCHAKLHYYLRNKEYFSAHEIMDSN